MRGRRGRAREATPRSAFGVSRGARADGKEQPSAQHRGPMLILVSYPRREPLESEQTKHYAHACSIGADTIATGGPTMGLNKLRRAIS